MNHIVIKQDTTGTEEVSSAVITALYNAVTDEYLDNNSELQGRLHSSYGGRKKIDYLTTTFQNLFITVDTYTIEFEDPEVERICVSKWGDNDGNVTLTTIQEISNGLGRGTFDNNSLIKTFNEFQYFTGLSPTNLQLDGTFQDCSNLEEITLPNNIYALSATFYNCEKLKSIIIPGSVRYCFYSCFNGCKQLKTLEFTGLIGECSIGRNLNNLESFTINEGCTKLSIRLCPKLTSITIPESCTTWDIQEMAGLTSVVLNHSTLTSIPYCAFSECTVLSQIQGLDFSNVTTIGDYAFWKTSSLIIEDVNCPNLISIGNGAFGHSKVKKITSLGSVTNIPQQCFEDCSSLSTFNLSNFTSFGDGCFNDDVNTIFTGTISPITLGNSSFRNCTHFNSSNIDFSNCTSIGEWCFQQNGFTGKIYLPVCTSIGSGNFNNCTGITEVDLPEVVSAPYQNQFSNCINITKVSAPKLQTLFGLQAMTNLTEVYAPKAKSITTSAFENCRSLQSLTLDFTEITNIPSWCFCNCLSLTGTFDFAKLETISTQGFQNCTFNIILRNSTIVECTGYNALAGFTGKVYVPDNLLNNYKVATQWADIQSNIYPISDIEPTQ